ncbi:hypothetical protein GCM10010399_69810 [Dactylosporangium fulvum]|uniref:HEAT repeat domain-containing protein n=1 Tax=Dactylosporangium fulvum TaxID=53359 RepID=A0ABY5W2I3_9ACTN|nr:hypothetical protein [Dactylosporangium fulvum]UWP83585.1 hypothetical protein Dfulv_04710 [Dactylosporangium fulvum]
MGTDNVVWDRLFHAYGVASSAPVYLAALRRDELAEVAVDSTDYYPAKGVPYSYLWSALYCGGRLTPATAAALPLLARWIGEPGFGADNPTLREGVIWFFREVARTVCGEPDMELLRELGRIRDNPVVAAWLDEYLIERRSVFDWTDADEPGKALLAAAVMDCFDLLPKLFAAVEPMLHHSARERTRTVTASAAVMLVRHPALRVRRSELLRELLRQAASAEDPYCRASLLLDVGDLGGDPRAWLGDPHVGVRLCAALAPAHSLVALAATSNFSGVSWPNTWPAEFRPR